MSTVELEGPPTLSSLYRRAVLGLLRRPSGDTLPDRSFVLRGLTIGRLTLAEYDRVCGFRLSDTLPPTYPHIMAFPMAMRLMSWEDFPFAVIGLVHIANRITVHRPIRADERLDVAVHAENLREHERGRQFDVVAVVTVDGSEVWRGVSTYLRKERSGERASGERTAAPAPSAVWRVSRALGTEYAAVSGDHNPIHTSWLGARLFGFPRPIAHGMWSKARCLAALEGRLPDAYTVDVSFKLPILLPATVAFSETPDQSFALHDARSGKPHLTGAFMDR